MRYPPPTKELSIENRRRLLKEIKPHSLVIVHANDIYPTNADGVMPFVQNSDIFYLCAVDQEETVLMLYPDAHDEKMRELLFIRETTEMVSIWEGEKLTKQEAADRSGIPLHSIHWLGEFENIFRTLMFQSRRVYLNTNEHARAAADVESRDLRFVRRCQEQFPLHRLERLAPLMHHLRVIKSKLEVELIREAVKTYGLDADLTLGALGERLRSDQALIITTVEVSDRRTHFLKSYNANDRDLKLWEAVLVSSSAPSVATRVLGRIGSFSRMVLRIASMPEAISSFASNGVLPTKSS